MENMKLWDWVVWNQRLKWKIIEYFMPSKTIFFFFCMYKMLQISKEEYEQVFYTCDPKKQKYRHELMPSTKFQQCRTKQNDLVERKIKSCRKSSKRFLEFKKMLGLDRDVVTCDKQDIIKILHNKFEGETIITQYSIKNKRLDADMPEYKIGREIDKYNHGYRNFNYGESRTKMIENHEITLIRTNPDNPNFDIKNLIIQIGICIKEAIKKQTKKPLIEDL